MDPSQTPKPVEEVEQIEIAALDLGSKSLEPRERTLEEIRYDRHVLRKVDLTVLPLLSTMYFLASLVY